MFILNNIYISIFFISPKATLFMFKRILNSSKHHINFFMQIYKPICVFYNIYANI